jgi:hypothetical protein
VGRQGQRERPRRDREAAVDRSGERERADEREPGPGDRVAPGGCAEEHDAGGLGRPRAAVRTAIEVVVHHQHRDARRRVGRPRQGRRPRQPAPLEQVAAGHAGPDAGEGHRLAHEGAVGGAQRRQRVEDGAGQPAQPEQRQRPAPDRRGDQPQRAGRDGRARSQPRKLPQGEQPGGDDLAPAADRPRRGVAVGAGPPVGDLVHAVGHEALEEHPHSDRSQVAPGRDRPLAPREPRPERDPRVRPQQHRDHADLEIDAEQPSAHRPHDGDLSPGAMHRVPPYGPPPQSPPQWGPPR